MIRLRLGTCLAFTFLVLNSFGCDDGSTVKETLPRVAVSGTVTLGGSPLAQGRIQFLPPKDSNGVLAVGEISDGKYSIPVTSGPVPGKYKIMISSRSPSKSSAGEEPGGMPKPEPELVPTKYNVKSELESEVTEKGANPANFTLDKN